MKLRNRVKRHFRYPNNWLFVLSLLLFILFLIVEVIVRSYNLYFHFPEMDVVSHFTAGTAIFSAILWILSVNKSEKCVKWAFIYTTLISLVWEGIETLEELVIPNPDYLRDIFFWDGFWDIVTTLVGAVVIFMILTIVKKRTYYLDELNM